MDSRSSHLRIRLARMLAARLVLLLAVFLLVLWVAGQEAVAEGASRRALYATLAVAFGVTALSAAALRVVRDTRRLAVVQVAIDVAIVSALVASTGGADSVFSFLYLPVAVVGALLLGRPGAYAAALGGSAGYGGVLLGARLIGGGGTAPAELLAPIWGVHSAALLLVALLASTLVRELHVAGERLDARTHDLRKLRRLHARTVESLTSGLLTLDQEGRVSSFNPEASRITGLEAAEALGRPLEGLLPGATEVLEESKRGRSRDRNRLRYVHPGGSVRHLGLAGSILREEDGSPAGQVVIFQDVTDVVEMEHELRRSERLAAIGQLAAAIAHEVRNPLASISGAIEMLRSDGGGRSRPLERGKLMEIVLREIERLDLLITDFLCYARPAPTKLERVRLAAVVRELASVIQTASPEDLRLRTSVAEDLELWGDPAQIRQLLWNLLGNAVHAVDGKGSISLSARRIPARDSQPQPQGRPGIGRGAGMETEGWAELTVQDDGCGIAPEEMERIFDPFFTTKREGSGLGLATVHRIVEAHGGSIRVESRPGQGTRFAVQLPCAEERA